VYDAMGSLAAEYMTGAPAASGTQYLAADHLGSTRMVTGGPGSPSSQTAFRDYLPFGYEIPATIDGRGSSYSETDNPRQKFTGKERDAETGLDFFGARYFSAAQGRFTTPDWSAIPEPVPYASLNDPQSLNLYAYVRNNPLRNRDLDGHWCLFGIGTTCSTPPPPPDPPKPPPGPKMKGVNPVTGQQFFRPDPKGKPGHERPGVGGAGSFGANRGTAGARRQHHGEDVSGPVGADVHAATSGTVTFSGPMSGYGNTVKVDDGHGTVTLYGHNSANEVGVGDDVLQGQVIGTLGQTGNAAGQPASESHVHFEVHIDGELVNPSAWLNSDVDVGK
jgi:RHS repeat-associated protein